MSNKQPVTDKKKTPADAEYEVVGTKPFDIFPSYEEWISQFDFTKNPDMGGLAEAHFGHLPVWIEGNAYFGGATVSKHEKKKNHLEDKKTKVTVEIKEKDGDWYLKTNYEKALAGILDGIITTDTLGKAFEPEQRFENTDGTPITFDLDFFGNHRSSSTIPGPLSSVGSKEFLVFKKLEIK